MAESLFELGFLGGAALRRMEKHFPNMEKDYPWDSLNPENYPDHLIQRARLGWTGLAGSSCLGCTLPARS